MFSIFFSFFLFFYFFLQHKRRSGYSPTTIILLVYLLSYMASVILRFCYDFREEIEIYDLGVLYLLLLLLLYFYPLLRLNDSPNVIFVPIFSTTKVLLAISTILSIYSVVFFSTSIGNLFSMNVSDVATARDDIDRATEYAKFGILNTIAGTIAMFYQFQMLLAFVYLVHKRKIDLLFIIALVGTMSYPLFVLSAIGRDGVLFWVMTFIMLYMFFYRFISHATNKKLVRIFVLISIVFAGIFVFITLGRFVVGYGKSMDLIESVFSYLGQGPIQFPDLLSIDVEPLFFSNYDDISIIGDKNALRLEEFGTVSYIFRTFVGSFYMYFGFWGSIFVAILVSLFVRVMCPGIRWNFGHIVFFVMYTNLLIQGVFYFRQYNSVGIFWICIMILLSLFFRLFKQDAIAKS